MVEGEATQEPSAPEGAPASPPDESPVELHDSAPPVSEESEPSASAEVVSEGLSESAAESSGGAARLDWSHLRGFQTVEPPGEATFSREDYASELVKELAARATRFANAVDESIVLSSDGLMRWLGDPIARVVAGDGLLTPRAVLLADEALAGEDRGKVDIRAALWLGAHVKKLLGPLVSLAEGGELPEAARGLGAKIAEALGVLERERVRIEARALDQTARATMRKLGVRFGSQYIYVPILLKPAARGLCTLLWTLRRGAETGADRLLAFASAGRTSFANEGLLSPDAYRVAGFRLCGERVVRVDIIERLADLIRAALPDHMRNGSRPTSDAYGFAVTPQMTSLTGCSGEAFASILRSLGFEPFKVSKAAFELANRRAPIEPIKPAAPEEATAEAATGEGEAEAATGEALTAAHETETGADITAEALATSPEAAPGEDADLVAAEAPEGSEAAAPEPDHVEAASEEGAVSAGEPSLPPAALPSASPAEIEAAAPAARPEEEAGLPTASMEAAVADDPAETPGEPSAEALGVEDSATPAAEAAPEQASETVEEIEIWRPAQRRARAPQRPQTANGEAHAHSGKPRDQRRRRRPDQPAQAPVATEGEAPAPTAQTAREPDRRHEDRGKREYKGKDEARQREERRPPRDFGPRREPRPVQIDPDSPFAKLAALKPLLERRDKRT